MTSFAEFLNAQNADPEAVFEATRLWVGVKSDDTPLEVQRETLIKVLQGRPQLERILSQLSEDPEFLEAFCLLVLSRVWEHPDETALIAGVFAGAEGKLPVTDRMTLTVAAMYAMYLLATGGGLDIHQTTVREPSGKYHQELVITHAPFASAVDPMIRMFDLGMQSNNGSSSATKEPAKSGSPGQPSGKFKKASRANRGQRGSRPTVIGPTVGRRANTSMATCPTVSSRQINPPKAAGSEAPSKLKVTTPAKASSPTPGVDKTSSIASTGKTKVKPRGRN